MTSELTDRERGVLHRIERLDAELQNMSLHPEHSADVAMGAVWSAAGVPWRPETLYATKWSRTEQQQISRARLSLERAGLLGRTARREVDVLGMPWPTQGYYFLTTAGYEMVRATYATAETRTDCRADGCTRWIPPTRPEGLCVRCDGGPNRLVPANGYRSRFTMQAAVSMITDGWPDVAWMITDADVARGLTLTTTYRKQVGHSLLDEHYRVAKVADMPDAVPVMSKV